MRSVLAVSVLVGVLAASGFGAVEPSWLQVDGMGFLARVIARLASLHEKEGSQTDPWGVACPLCGCTREAPATGAGPQPMR